MHFRQFRPGGQHLAEPGIVLHRARAEETDPHHAQGFLAQMEVMALNLELTHFGQRGAILSAHRRWDQIVGVADLRKPTLWVARQAANYRLVRGVACAGPGSAVSRWEWRCPALPGCQSLEKVVPARGDEPHADEFDAEIAELANAGYPVDDVQLVTPDAALGAAALAGVGSGLVRGWDRYYKAIDE